MARTNTYSLTKRQSRQAREGLLGKAQDPFAAGNALARYGGFYEGGLGRVQTQPSAGMQNVLAGYQGLQQRYAQGGRSADVNDYLQRMRAGLQGYSSPEMQGMREQAQRGVDTSYATGLAQQRIAQARGGARGASAAAQAVNLNRERMGQQQMLEQDLFVRNADEMQRRLAAYGNALSGAEADEFNRATGTLGGLAGAQNAVDARMSEAERANLDRLMAERSGALSSVLTAADLGQSRRRFDEQMNFYREALRRGRVVGMGG